jgi:serine/threonine protein phosphatase PrpC
VAYTHPGGSKPLDAKNQDTYFHLAIDDHNQVFGVLDGHGSENGTLVAEVASGAIKAYLAEHFNRLRTEPEAVFITAFERAHEAARQAVRKVDPAFKMIKGVVVDEWEDEDGTMHKDAVDGGTTATVIALVDGSTLVHAQVGDSSALLGGTIKAGEEGEGEATFEELMEEHAATNVKEYERMLGSGSRGREVQFIYDVPDLIDDGKAPQIFKKVGGGHDLDVRSRRLAEVHGACAKNARGDLPAILLTPETDAVYGDMEPQSLAMTRSIGDFYMQTFGVSWKPEVISVDLADVGVTLDHLTLVLASDGIWDLWEYEEVFQGIACPPRNGVQGVDDAQAFLESCVTRGTEMFDETADNMTGMVVYLNPVGTKTTGPKNAAAAPTPAKPSPRNESTPQAAGRFSV